jgi:hypothetical protein
VTWAMRAGPSTTMEARTGSRILAESGNTPRGSGGAYLDAGARYVVNQPHVSLSLGVIYVVRKLACYDSCDSLTLN